MSASETTNDVPREGSTTHDCRCKPLKNPVRAERRKHNATVAATAIEIDKSLNANIDSAAEKLDVPREELATHFALKSVFGEKRPPTVFNGLMAEKSKQWANEYVGPGKGFLPYISKRIKDENLVAKVEKDGQSEKYLNIAREARTNKKSSEGASHSRAAALKRAQASLANINKELMFIHKTTGIEYLLCVNRAKFNDQMDPHYYASDKAIRFLEGNINVPVKDFLQLLDMSIVGGVGGLQAPIQGKKDLYRKKVRSLLNASYCQTLHAMGHDTSNFRHIEYTNYADLVEKLRIVVRGYPLTAQGHLVQPSEFPKGLKGLINAEKHLESGQWGFERIQDAAYDEWMNKRRLVVESGDPPPLPPAISVAGTSIEEILLAPSSGPSEAGSSSKKRAVDTTASKITKKAKKSSKPAGKQGSKTGRKKGAKSAETISSDLDDDSDDEEWEKRAAKQLNGESDEDNDDDSDKERENDEDEDKEGEGEGEDEEDEGGDKEGEDKEDEEMEDGGEEQVAGRGLNFE